MPTSGRRDSETLPQAQVSKATFTGPVERHAQARVPTEIGTFKTPAELPPAQIEAITPPCASDLRNSGQYGAPNYPQPPEGRTLRTLRLRLIGQLVRLALGHQRQQVIQRS